MIILKDMSKEFKNGEERFYALENISTEISENKVTIITGSSGNGKSTSLSNIGLLQSAMAEEVNFLALKVKNILLCFKLLTDSRGERT